MPLHPHQCLQFTNPTASVTSSSGSKPTISALVVEQLYCWWIFRNRFSRELGVFNSTFTLIKKKKKSLSLPAKHARGSVIQIKMLAF